MGKPPVNIKYDHYLEFLKIVARNVHKMEITLLKNKELG